VISIENWVISIENWVISIENSEPWSQDHNHRPKFHLP
jgi:hypothetical protein